MTISPPQPSTDPRLPAITAPHTPEPAPPEEPRKHRCPVDGRTQLYYLPQGISYRCPQCKNVDVVSWEEIFQRYQEVRKD